MSAYLFVDGHYLRKAFEKTMEAFFGEVPAIEYRQLISLGASHSRVFYYDAVDYEARDKETPNDTSARVSERVALHRHINSIPNFHVREGYVSTGRKGGCPVRC